MDASPAYTQEEKTTGDFGRRERCRRLSEGYGDKKHPSPGNQASPAMLHKEQCVSRSKEDTKLLLQAYFPAAE